MPIGTFGVSVLLALLGPFEPSLASRLSGQQTEPCTEATSFTKVRLTFQNSGPVDITRPSPSGAGTLTYDWVAGEPQFLGSKDRKECKDRDFGKLIVEAFADSDTAPFMSDFNLESRNDAVLKDGQNTGPLKNRIGLAFAIVVSCCPRFSFTNVITNDQWRFFHPDGTVVKVRAKFPARDGASVDTVLVWPRVATLQTMLLRGEVVPVSGIFGDNPGYTAPKAGSIFFSGLGIPPTEGEFGQPAPAPGQPTKVQKDTVINNENDFLTGIFCDEDGNKNTSPVRKGAEQLCAIVQWGYKAKIHIGAKPEDNVGLVHPKIVKVICGPGAGEPESPEFAQAKATFAKAFSDGTFTAGRSFTTAGKQADYEIFE